MIWRKRIFPDSAARDKFIRIALLLVVAVLGWTSFRDNFGLIGTAIQVPVEGVDHGGDFISFYAAGKLFDANHNGDAYNLDKMREAEFQAHPDLRNRDDWKVNQLAPFLNIPAYLPVVGFFANYTLPSGFAISSALEMLLVGVIFALTTLLAVRWISPIAGLVWVILVFGYNHTWQGLQYGQLPTYIVVVAFIIGTMMIRSGDSVAAGLILSVMIIKPQYLLPVIVFLIVLKYWRTLAALIAGCAVAGVLSLLAVGWDGVIAFVKTNIDVGLAPKGLYFSGLEWMYNWRGVLERLLPNSSSAVYTIGQGLLILATYAVAVWGWRALAPGGGKANGWKWDAAMLVLAITTIIASPHTHGQDMAVLVVGLAYVVGPLWSEKLPAFIAPLTAMGVFMIFLLMPLPTWYGLTLNNITLAMLLVVGALAMRGLVMVRFTAPTLEAPRMSLNAQAAAPGGESS